MGLIKPFHTLGVAAALVLLAACSGGPSSAVAPVPAKAQVGSHLHLTSHYACPATGAIEYVADFFKNVVNVYAGKFANQAPCGQIASASLNGPTGLYVQTATHDLYVANKDGHNVLVFHRGQLTPYNTYTDPSVQYPIDVTVARDGTVLASNYTNVDQTEAGSISTWITGPSGGTFVGNFPMTNSEQGAYIAVKKSGKVYFDDVDRTMLQGFVWYLFCPAGVCGAQTPVAGVSLKFPGGMAIDYTGDLLVTDSFAVTADTFELPNPKPSTFPLVGMPLDMVVSTRDHHLFTTDAYHNDALEYSYPSGALIGTVSGVSGGFLDGVAVDL